MPTAIQRIVVLRPNHRLGNVVLLTALVHELGELYPRAEIELVTAGGAARAVFASSPRVTAIHSFPAKSYHHPGRVLRLLWQLRRRSYDLAVDPMPRSRASRFLLRFVRARERIGYRWGSATQDGMLTGAAASAAAPLHWAEKPVYLVRSTYRAEEGAEFDASAIMRPLGIGLTAEERHAGERELATALGSACLGEGPIIGIFANATGDKRFASEWWRAVVDVLRVEAPRLRLVQLLPEDGSGRIADDLPTVRSSDLRRVGAMLAASSLVVSADCGVMHLADASGAAVLGLFKTTQPSRFGPRGPASEALLASDESPAALAARIISRLSERG